MRLRIDLSYDGTGFHGWASQPGLRTVQGQVEEALSTVLRTPLTVTCAGRTDTGVHARGQVVHVDLPDRSESDRGPGVIESGIDLRRLGRRLNGVLDDDVRIREVRRAAPGFDARFGAQWRRYVYRIADTPAAMDPLARHQVVTWPRRLDEHLMNQAAALLLGEHDFAAFCKRREGATTIRTLLDLRVDRLRSGLETTVRADAFCHSMVRALMGCLVAVGEGRRDPAWAGRVLVEGVRDSGVTVMPARGLTLEEVGYPEDHDLVAQTERTRRVRTR